MAVIEKDVQEAMNNVAYRYVHEFRMNIQSVLDKPKYKVTGMLRSSVRVSLTEANDFEPPVINLVFEEYGEYLTKKKLLYTKYPPIKELAEWVDRMGFADGSAAVPGYSNGAPTLPAFKRAERIAWAIATKKRNVDRFKRKLWKKESLPDVLREMNSETMDRWGSLIERMFKESLEKL